jgi:hypothetical protein
VGNSLDSRELAEGVRALGGRLGSVERLIGTLEELQVPLADRRRRGSRQHRRH